MGGLAGEEAAAADEPGEPPRSGDPPSGEESPGLPEAEPWAPRRLVRTCVASLVDSRAFGPLLAGEAQGRWLWLMLRPASAILLLRDEWILRDVSVTGPQLVALPFGGPSPAW